MSDGTSSKGWLDDGEWTIKAAFNPSQSVLIAKPSGQATSDINYGSPSEVPNKPGCFFPYFNGMMAPDASHMRELVHQLFFRLLPTDENGSPEVAWKNMRVALMSLASTPEGLALHHVLLGAKMALDAQARLYLVFGDEEYKGFCLLGECFSVFHSNVEHMPLSAEDLRFELSKVPSKATARSELASALSALKLTGGDSPILTADSVNDPFVVANTLAKVDLEESGEEDIKKVQEALKRMAFRNEYKSYSPSSISDSINDLLLHQRGFSTWNKLPFFIPIKDWNGIDDPIFQILARFGSSSFSFVAPRGTAIRIPDKLSDDATVGVFAVKEEPTNKVYFYDKPVMKAVVDWKALLKTGSVKYDVLERAGSMKAMSFSGPSRIPIVNALIQGQLRDLYGKFEESSSGSDGKGKGKAPAQPEVDFEEEFVLVF